MDATPGHGDYFDSGVEYPSSYSNNSIYYSAPERRVKEDCPYYDPTKSGHCISSFPDPNWNRCYKSGWANPYGGLCFWRNGRPGNPVDDCGTYEPLNDVNPRCKHLGYHKCAETKEPCLFYKTQPEGSVFPRKRVRKSRIHGEISYRRRLEVDL